MKVDKGVRVVEEELADGQQGGRKWIEARMATDLRTRYAVTPAQDLPTGASLELTLADAVHGAAGPLTLDGTRSWSFRTYGAMSVEAAQACHSDLGAERGAARTVRWCSPPPTPPTPRSSSGCW